MAPAMFITKQNRQITILTSCQVISSKTGGLRQGVAGNTCMVQEGKFKLEDTLSYVTLLSHSMSGFFSLHERSVNKQKPTIDDIHKSRICGLLSWALSHPTPPDECHEIVRLIPGF